MAQLAHCPACHNEVALPEESEAGDARQQWCACPECDEVFAVADAKPHVVKQARLVTPPRDSDVLHRGEPASPKEPEIAATPEVPLPKYGSSTLASFLDDDDKNEPGSADTKSDAPTLAEFESLDDLIRRGPSELPKYEPSDATIAHGETVEFDSAVDEGDDAGDVNDLEEPSPVADRLRPKHSELYRRESAESNEEDDLSSYDPVEDLADERDETQVAEEHFSPEESVRRLHDFSIPSSIESTLRDRGDLLDTDVASSAADAPSFDFEVGDSRDDSGAKSLRAAMGFGGDEPLELEDPIEGPDFAAVVTNDDETVAPELSVGADAPRGKVATRKRSGVMSAVRTLVGVAGGGVVGIAAGYLLLLWIFHFLGRNDEPLALAQYYPDVVKPSTFQDSTSTPPIVGGNSDWLAEGDARVDDEQPLEPMEDSSVETAAFEAEVTPPDDGPEPWEFGPQPAPPALITGAPSYTAAELQELTGVAQEVAADLIAPGPVDKVKGSSYARIAKLAEALTFGEGAADVSWKNNAREVFPPLLATDESRKQVSTIAEFWLVSPKRGHGGIFFCGTPDAGRQQGSVAEYTITLPTDSRQQITVLAPRALSVDTAEAAAVAVIGAVIDDPAGKIDGYTGTAQQAIWSTDVYPITE